MNEEERRRYAEKQSMFAFRYGARSKTLRQLATIKPLRWWERWLRKIRGVRCLTCRVTLNDSYWKKRYPNGAAFENLVRLICEDRQRCMECALAEEAVERESNKSI